MVTIGLLLECLNTKFEHETDLARKHALSIAKTEIMNILDEHDEPAGYHISNHNRAIDGFWSR